MRRACASQRGRLARLPPAHDAEVRCAAWGPEQTVPWLMPVLVAALQVGSFISPPRYGGPARALPVSGRTSLEGSLVCETVQVPRRVVRRIFVLDTVTRCAAPDGG